MFKISNKKWCTIDSESNGSYSHHDPKNFLTKSIESSLCDYSDAYILVKGNIAVTRTITSAGDNPVQLNQPLYAVTQVAFKNCALFRILEQKSMILFLMKQMLLTLHSLCTI